MKTHRGGTGRKYPSKGQVLFKFIPSLFVAYQKLEPLFFRKNLVSSWLFGFGCTFPGCRAVVLS